MTWRLRISQRQNIPEDSRFCILRTMINKIGTRLSKLCSSSAGYISSMCVSSIRVTVSEPSARWAGNTNYEITISVTQNLNNAVFTISRMISEFLSVVDKRSLYDSQQDKDPCQPETFNIKSRTQITTIMDPTGLLHGRTVDVNFHGIFSIVI